MGSGRWDADSVRAYASYSHKARSESVHETFSQRGIHENLDPRRIKVRESRDSSHNPESTPVIVALDVTGSMGVLAHQMAREGLGKLFTTILDRKPVTDPHLMFMAVGDANHDRAPLQVSQFEADKRIIEQLAQIYVEGGGGGNTFESYNLPWFFAATHTVHDAMEKRGKRGFLFTVGDECAPHDLTVAQIQRFVGDTPERMPSTKELLTLCQRFYDVFHVVVEEGDYASTHLERVMSSWTELLGQHVIPLADHTKLSEVIVSALEVAAGDDAEVVSARWDDETGKIVRRAVKSLPRLGGPVATV